MIQLLDKYIKWLENSWGVHGTLHTILASIFDILIVLVILLSVILIIKWILSSIKKQNRLILFTITSLIFHLIFFTRIQFINFTQLPIPLLGFSSPANDQNISRQKNRKSKSIRESKLTHNNPQNDNKEIPDIYFLTNFETDYNTNISNDLQVMNQVRPNQSFETPNITKQNKEQNDQLDNKNNAEMDLKNNPEKNIQIEKPEIEIPKINSTKIIPKKNDEPEEKPYKPDLSKNDDRLKENPDDLNEKNFPFSYVYKKKSKDDTTDKNSATQINEAARNEITKGDNLSPSTKYKIANNGKHAKSLTNKEDPIEKKYNERYKNPHTPDSIVQQRLKKNPGENPLAKFQQNNNNKYDFNNLVLHVVPGDLSKDAQSYLRYILHKIWNLWLPHAQNIAINIFYKINRGGEMIVAMQIKKNTRFSWYFNQRADKVYNESAEIVFRRLIITKRPPDELLGRNVYLQFGLTNAILNESNDTLIVFGYLIISADLKKNDKK